MVKKQSSKILDDLDSKYGKVPKRNKYSDAEMEQREPPTNITKEEGKEWYKRLSKKHKITNDQKKMYNRWIESLDKDGMKKSVQDMQKSIKDMNNTHMEKSIKDMQDAVAVLDHTPQLEKINIHIK